MRSRVPFLISLFLFLTAAPQSVIAEPLKVSVPGFAVTGTKREELKTALSGLLASRLNPDRAQLVENPADAELSIAGSFTQFGTVFSIDVVLKSRDGKSLRTIYEQGEGENDLIPALGRLARKIDNELAKTAVGAPAATRPPASPLQPTAAPSPRTEEAKSPPAPQPKEGATGWTSAPIEGVFVGMAVGRRLPSGERELFLAGDRAIRYFLQSTDMRQVAAIELEPPLRILGIDSADLDGDGVPELYVTVMDRDTLASRVYIPRGDKLEKIADGMPYFFRGMEQRQGNKRILVQTMGMEGEFYGGVAELVRKGTKFETLAPRDLPAPGNLYNFALLSDPAGRELTVVLNDDGYLIATSPEGKQLWQGSDKFGGTERFYKRETLSEKKFSMDQYRWFYLEQRLTVTPGGTLLVPRNDGFFVVGNLRSYTKHSLHALHWTGARLEETWRSKESPSYLADYAFDPGTGELIQLEIAQKESLLGKGQSIITVTVPGTVR